MAKAETDAPAAAAQPGWEDDPCWRRIAELTEKIADAEKVPDRLRDERSECFAALLEAGAPRSVVAERAGMTSMAVKFDLQKYPRIRPAT